MSIVYITRTGLNSGKQPHPHRTIKKKPPSISRELSAEQMRELAEKRRHSKQPPLHHRGDAALD